MTKPIQAAGSIAAWNVRQAATTVDSACDGASPWSSVCCRIRAASTAAPRSHAACPTSVAVTRAAAGAGRCRATREPITAEPRARRIRIAEPGDDEIGPVAKLRAVSRQFAHPGDRGRRRPRRLGITGIDRRPDRLREIAGGDDRIGAEPAKPGHEHAPGGPEPRDRPRDVGGVR